MGSTRCEWTVLWEAIEPKPGVWDNAYLRRIAKTVKTPHNYFINPALLRSFENSWPNQPLPV